MFLSGKVNIKGLYPNDVMISHLFIIQSYLEDKNNNIIFEKYTDEEEILQILNSCSSVDIDEDY
jgi:hypothetical protein